MSVLWILVPAPFVGFLIADSFRRVFSDDDRLLWKVFQDQPVTMFAATTALGSVVVWVVVEVVSRAL